MPLRGCLKRRLAGAVRRSRPFHACLLILALVAVPAGAAEPVDTSYRLGPGDLIRIHVYGEEDLSTEVRLPDTGRLNYPFLGELMVEGRTTNALQQEIMEGLKGPYLVDPIVTVTITEYRPFFVYGEVREPGGIPYQPRLTVARAVALAGGFTERASRNRIQVIRGSDPSETARPIELSDPVYPGDILTVRQSFF